MASSSRISGSAPKSPESFESLNRRNAAAEILQSYEKLSWYSFQRCESLTQTRLHFQNIVAGFTEEDEAKLVDWQTDNTPHPSKAGEEQRTSRKGKERASTGAGAGGDGVAGSSTQKSGQTKQKKNSGAGADGSAKKKRRSDGTTT